MSSQKVCAACHVAALVMATVIIVICPHHYNKSWSSTAALPKNPTLCDKELLILHMPLKATPDAGKRIPAPSLWSHCTVRPRNTRRSEEWICYIGSYFPSQAEWARLAHTFNKLQLRVRKPFFYEYVEGYLDIEMLKVWLHLEQYLLQWNTSPEHTAVLIIQDRIEKKQTEKYLKFYFSWREN